MGNKLTYTVPGLPPSYNQSFKIAFKLGSVYLSVDAKKYKQQVIIHTPHWDVAYNKDLKLRIDLEFRANWYYKNGKMKKKDIQNMDKLVIDAVFTKLGIDDSHVWYNSNSKVQSDKHETQISLEII